jgi:hypothetical protein
MCVCVSKWEDPSYPLHATLSLSPIPSVVPGGQMGSALTRLEDQDDASEDDDEVATRSSTETSWGELLKLVRDECCTLAIFLSTRPGEAVEMLRDGIEDKAWTDASWQVLKTLWESHEAKAFWQQYQADVVAAGQGAELAAAADGHMGEENAPAAEGFPAAAGDDSPLCIAAMLLRSSHQT